MSKAPQRNAARESSAKTKALAEANEQSEEYSDDEDAAAYAALKALESATAAASSRAFAREGASSSGRGSARGSGGVGGAASRDGKEFSRRGGVVVGARGGTEDIRADDSDKDYEDDSRDHGDNSDASEDDEDFADFFDGSSDEDGDSGGGGGDSGGGGLGDDDDELSSKNIVTEAEKSTIANIKEKLGFTEQDSFIKDMTKGLSAFVICHQKNMLTMEAKVDILLGVSFHQEFLSDASRQVICQQTVRAIKKIDLSKIKEESHKIFYGLANYRRTRLVAAMISNIDTVLAGILILQLSLAQVAAGRVMGESLAPDALVEQTTLLDHLMSLGPIEGVAQICTMVMANAMHVQRKKIKNHLHATRPPQLFDKKPIVHGMGTRAEQIGQFVVRVQVAVEGDMHSRGGDPAVVKFYGHQYKGSGIVSVLPAQSYDDYHHGQAVSSFPFMKTTYIFSHSLLFAVVTHKSQSCTLVTILHTHHRHVPHKHAHTHTHSHSHTHANTRKHPNTQTPKHPNTHSHTLTHTHPNTHSHSLTHTHTHTRKHPNTQTPKHSQTQTLIHSHTRTRTHTRTHANTHKHSHTHTRTHT
jgi:hypothetical protein